MDALIVWIHRLEVKAQPRKYLSERSIDNCCCVRVHPSGVVRQEGPAASTHSSNTLMIVQHSPAAALTSTNQQQHSAALTSSSLSTAAPRQPPHNCTSPHLCRTASWPLVAGSDLVHSPQAGCLRLPMPQTDCLGRIDSSRSSTSSPPTRLSAVRRSRKASAECASRWRLAAERSANDLCRTSHVADLMMLAAEVPPVECSVVAV